jgi:hypothetical protein
MNNFTDQTMSVIDRHLHAFTTNQGVDAIVHDYDPHAVLYAPEKLYRGVDEIRQFFKAFLNNLPDNGLQLFRVRTQDSFVVKGGKIVQQTYAAYIAPR